MENLEQLLEAIREKQKGQIASYEAQTCVVGEALEIPWDNHLPVRCYINRPAAKPQGKMKVFINAHGGGFIEGDAKQMGTYCQKLADSLGLFVVNVNYRLSPDYLYPYQCQEIDVIHDYLRAHAQELEIDLTHCGIGGFSAGATLSLNCIVRDIERGLNRYSCCVLGYPMVSANPDDNDQNSAYPAGDAAMMRAITYYFNGRDDTPACSPLGADEALLAKFPRVIEITCGKDSLREQGRRFAARLARVGVRLNYIEYAEARHGFIEVNRRDYEPDDPRKTPQQAALCEVGEAFIIDGLASML